MKPQQEYQADVTLLLEGTYPFVRGGVSAWVHDLIQGLEQYRFALVCLGAEDASMRTLRYELPANVVSLHTWPLFQQVQQEPGRDHGIGTVCSKGLRTLHDYFQHPGEEGAMEAFRQMNRCAMAGDGWNLDNFLFSRQAWEFIRERYQKGASDSGFSDYFWTIRSMHGALLRMLELRDRIPPTGVFHAISTGYAGFLGAVLHEFTQRPLLLTEHGIYTKERRIDLQAAYLQQGGGGLVEVAATGMSYHHELWIRFFEGLGRLVYASASEIVALYERNRERQIKDGAPAERSRVIPNGIDVGRLQHLRTQRPARTPPVLGLIGRIVSIKDIKTFIRAMKTVTSRIPGAQGWLIGPEDEDVEYARECRDLVASLGLEENVLFLGYRNIEEILPKLGLLVLTSISEAFPLVILEAYASGLPVLATDVGACREIIEGRPGEDAALGSAGAVVPIANPEQTAEAAVELLTNEQSWSRAQQAGIKRAERYYTRELVMDSYRKLYDEAMQR